MLKAKICTLAAVCLFGISGISPITAYAAETDSESVILSDNKEDQKERRSAFEEKMRQANEKWNALTPKQKKEVYGLLDKELKANLKLMDKLGELGVFEEEDVTMYKNHMKERLDKVIEEGVFPLLMGRDKKSSK